MKTTTSKPARTSLALLVLLGAVFAWAGPEAIAEQVRAPDGLAVTPDGRTLVFSWRGDLWRAPVSGGAATRLTSHPARDISPSVSLDGRTIAFVSDRTGSRQVHVMSIEGGAARQVTAHTEGFGLHGWTPDGEALLVSARLDHHWREGERFFLRRLDPAAPLELLFDAYGSNGQLSPDGRRLAFTREGTSWWRKGYRGSQSSQVWVYDLTSKTFTQVTSKEHGERWPLWAPGGRDLLLTSQEDGTFNLWRVSLDGRRRERLTSFEDDGVQFPAASADGAVVVFRRLFDIYRLDVKAGGKAVPIEIDAALDDEIEDVVRETLDKASEAAFTEDAREVAIVAGGDVWVMDTELREPKRVTDTPCPESDVVFSPDFQRLYFVRDEGGRPDIWSARRADESRWWWQNDAFVLERLTDDEAHESSLSFTPDGKRLAFVRGRGELVTVLPDGTEPVVLVSSWNRPQYSFSPDGAWVAYAVDDDDFNSDVWIRRADGTGEPFNLSVHPDHDGEPAWSPDGKMLAFVGKRWGDEADVCVVWLQKQDHEKDKRDRTLEKAIEKMKGRKAKAAAPKASEPKADGAGAEATRPEGLPGTWRGRAEGGDLPAEGLPFTLIFAQTGEAWSVSFTLPDVFDGAGEDLVVDEAAGTFRFRVETPLGRVDVEGRRQEDRLKGTWTRADGTQGTFEATREGPAPAPPEESPPEEGKETEKPKPEKPAKKEPEPVVIDFDGLPDRIQRISIPNSFERGLMWSPDGKRLAFRATVDGEDGLYTVELPDEPKPKRLTGTTGSGGRWLAEGNQIAWLAGGVPQLVSSAGKPTSLPFKIVRAVDAKALHGAAFDVAWRIMRDAYYDERMGNRDWSAIHGKYAPFARDAATPEELSLVVNLMLGELNGSHLGFWTRRDAWSPSGWRPVTGHLGARWDETHTGEGWRVKDVVHGTPAWEQRTRLEPGELVLTIDGRAVGPNVDPAEVLTGEPGREVDVLVRDAEGKERTVRMRPTTYGRVRLGLYEDWLAQSRRRVAELSDGRLGYLHVRGMNWSSFQRFEEELYKVAHGKEGLVIDVRDNGGGFTTDHLLTCLTQPRHAFTVPRGGGPGYPQDRMVYARWDKPIVVLCNQDSFSNAEIFAHAIKTLKRGRVVGVPTAGGVISTGSADVMGVGTIRLPFRGWYLLPDGADMELNGCVPDVVLWPSPGELPSGVDRQLEKAVELLLEDVELESRKPRPRPQPASTQR